MPELPLVLVTEDSDATPLAWLKERARVIEAAPGSPEFDAALPDAVGMVVRTYTKVNAALLARAPKLKVVGRGGVGLENIDVPACRARGVEVVYTPDANTLAVGDFVIGYALQLLRPWAFFQERAYEPKEFKRVRNTLRGVQMNELTIGILGMGRVGRRVGHIAANGFGMRVIYNDLLDVRPHLTFPATAVDKPTLFREADVVTLHVDMKPGNEHLVGTPLLSLMKPTAILINTSRGEVLDDAALAAAIRDEEDCRRRHRRVRPGTAHGRLSLARLRQRPAHPPHGRPHVHGDREHELGGPRRDGSPERADAEVSRAVTGPAIRLDDGF